jgi:hypothetical protein
MATALSACKAGRRGIYTSLSYAAQMGSGTIASRHGAGRPVTPSHRGYEMGGADYSRGVSRSKSVEPVHHHHHYHQTRPFIECAQGSLLRHF